jgi:hypothetical protein
MVEQRPFKALVASSSLAQPTPENQEHPHEYRVKRIFCGFLIRTHTNAKIRKKACSIGTLLAHDRCVPCWRLAQRGPRLRELLRNFERIIELGPSLMRCAIKLRVSESTI